MRRWFYIRKKHPYGFRIAAILLCAAGIVTVTMSYMSARFEPLVTRLAVARASNMVNRIVTSAVTDAVENGEIRYEDLISFEKDHDGRIAAIHSNIAVCNRLQSEILERILSRIEEIPPRDLSIPFGTLSGSPLLAGRGPRIAVRMESAGTSSAHFENTFTSAGINQTNHQIILRIDVSVTILLPGFTTSTKVSNAITVAETVIVGTVPETYTYFSAAPGDASDDAKDYVMNKG